MCAFPVNWPPPHGSGRHTLRFYASGTTTELYADNAFNFADNPIHNSILPLPTVTSSDIPAVGALPPPTHAVPRAPAGTVGSGTALSKTPFLWANSLHVFNDGSGDLNISFDGTNLHGVIKAGKDHLYRNRMEAGIAFAWAGGTGPTVTGTAQTFPFTATTGETLVVALSTDSGGSYPVTRTFTWPASVGPFANIAALVAALNTASSWNGGTLPTQFTVGNTGDAIKLTDLTTGVTARIKVDATSTGIAGAADASLQFTSGQTGSNGTGTATAFRVEAW